MATAGIGMALGGWLGGALFDMAGDYTWSLLTSLIAGCIGLPLALALPRHGETPPGSRGKIIPTPAAPAAPPSPQHRPA
jgi:MFS family permease